jgi:hypothetical protein
MRAAEVWLTGGRPSVVRLAPSQVCAVSTVGLTVGASTVRLDARDQITGWVGLGAACLAAAAEEMWPDGMPTVGLGEADAVAACLAAALRAVAVLAAETLDTSDLRALEALPQNTGGLLAWPSRRRRWRFWAR